MDKDCLEEFGLSKNESKVYMSLIELGSASAGQIAEKSKVHRTNVYDSIERLIKKGLVGYVMQGKNKYFQATDPQNLMNLLKEKEDKLKDLMPSLLINRELSNRTEVNVTEGIQAARHIHIGIIRHGEEILMYGVPSNAPDFLGQFHLDRFQNERIKAGVRQKVVYSPNATTRIEQLKGLWGCEVKVSPTWLDSPMSTNICGNEVVFKLYSRKPCLTIQIISDDISHLYKKYFEVMWKMAKDPD